MSKSNTVRLTGTTRLIETQSGAYVIVVDTDEELKQVTEGMERHRQVKLKVGRGSLMRLLPFKAEKFVELPEGSVFPVRTKDSGVIKFIR